MYMHQDLAVVCAREAGQTTDPGSKIQTTGGACLVSAGELCIFTLHMDNIINTVVSRHGWTR